MGAKLWVDDLRDPAAVDSETGNLLYVKDPENWTWCKTITEAIRLLSMIEVDEVSLDHDITHLVDENKTLVARSMACPETYAAVAYYIAAMDVDHRPFRVYVHTANPVGSGAIFNILSEAAKDGMEVIRRPA